MEQPKVYDSSDALRADLKGKYGAQSDIARMLKKSNHTVGKVIDANNTKHKIYPVIATYAQFGFEAARNKARELGLLLEIVR